MVGLHHRQNDVLFHRNPTKAHNFQFGVDTSCKIFFSGWWLAKTVTPSPHSPPLLLFSVPNCPAPLSTFTIMHLTNTSPPKSWLLDERIVYKKQYRVFFLLMQLCDKIHDPEKYLYDDLNYHDSLSFTNFKAVSLSIQSWTTKMVASITEAMEDSDLPIELPRPHYHSHSHSLTWAQKKKTPAAASLTHSPMDVWRVTPRPRIRFWQ